MAQSLTRNQETSPLKGHASNFELHTREKRTRLVQIALFVVSILLILGTIIYLCLIETQNLQSDILLIAGGSLRSAEVLSLSERPVSCDPVPNLPVYGAYGSFFKHGDDPVFCDGLTDGNATCYKYSTHSKKWQSFKHLTIKRQAPVKMEFEDYLLITGGWNGSQHNYTTDLWSPKGEEFIRGPDLPYPTQEHCIAVVNKSHAILTGGYNYEEKHVNYAYMFNKDTVEWTRINPMREKRFSHACGLIGNSTVLVAGGHNSYVFVPSVEVYDLNTQNWTSGPEMPEPISRATSVQLEDTFLIVGGYSYDTTNETNRVYEFDRAKGRWIRRKETLKVVRDYGPAVWRLPASYLNCDSV